MRSTIIAALLSLLIGVISNKTKISVQKCCGPDEIFNLNYKKCVYNPTKYPEVLKVTSFLDNSTSLLEYEVEKFNSKRNCNQKYAHSFEYDIMTFEGDIFFVKEKFNDELFTIDDVCFEDAIERGISSTGGAYVNYHRIAQKCLGCSKRKPCVNFCCGKDFVREGDNCVPSIQENLSEEFENITYINIERKCDTYFVKNSKSLWKYTSSGVLIDDKEYPLDKYCIDTVDQVALTCVENGARDTAKTVVMSISVVCIFIYIIFHCVIDELRSNHSTALKIPFCFFLALSFAIVIIICSFRHLLIETSSCIILGLLLQFSMISVFFWLTCLSFDVLMRFRRIQDLTMEVSRNHIYYSISIVCPAIITIITLFLQLLIDPNDDNSNFIHPGIGNNTCFFEQFMPQFVYYHLIIMILLGFNFIMFAFMVVLLAKGPWKLCQVSF